MHLDTIKGLNFWRVATSQSNACTFIPLMNWPWKQAHSLENNLSLFSISTIFDFSTSSSELEAVCHRPVRYKYISGCNQFVTEYEMTDSNETIWWLIQWITPSDSVTFSESIFQSNDSYFFIISGHENSYTIAILSVNFPTGEERQKTPADTTLSYKNNKLR